MKNLFRKYYHSTLLPGEFKEFLSYFNNKKNEISIHGEILPLWNQSLEENENLPEPNSALFKKVKDAIYLNERKILQNKIKIYSYSLRIAAILIVALLISSVVNYQKTSKIEFAAQMQTISTPFGARIKTVLPDSSIVWLNSGSSLTFPSVFGKFRKVTLLGEAFFEVTKNSKPFIVSSKGKEVEVKGTSFNVKSFTETNSFETTLVEGTVIVRNTVTMKEVTLRPGQHATLTGNEISVKNVETNNFTCWKDGKLIFNKEPFPDFIKKLERWYNVKIEYDDQKLNDLWYTGTIEMETISEVMEMLSIAAPVTYSFNNKERVFTIKAKESR